MRKPNTKAIILDAVPERRTKRYSPRDRFCGLTFTYLSSGKEDENCRPLNHVLEIPFIHSPPFIVTMIFYVYVSMVIKITKNLRNTFLEPQELSYAKNGPKNIITNIKQLRKKATTGHFAKPIAFEKWSVLG